MTLQLRALRESDLESLVELDSDPEVMRHLTAGVPTPRWVYEEFMLDRMLSFAREDARLGVFAIERQGRFLGWVMLRHDLDQPEWLEIGYRLRREAWGQGVASWAAEAMRRRAIEEIGIDTVCARTVPDNLGSRRVMEKIGLRYAGECQFPERVFADGRFRYPAMTGVVYVQQRADAEAR